MFNIWESQNFLWSDKKILGSGATSIVYRGVSKLSGDPVAVKTYNSSITHPEEQLREFDILRKIKHENIVQLIAIEENLSQRRKVIVMELCNGGSLLDNLMDPENVYGLKDSEFLLVSKHIYSGMKYLREHNIVHRDLKPGNIMKTIQEDGTTVYKLSDFGSARKLLDNETFQSLHGTKEYLSPDIYEHAILKKPSNRQFNSSVDLWSIGVTLYHIATGTLPFRAYNTYKNKETLHYMRTSKESGVISAVQTTHNGPITWSKELPPCLLSDSLKKYLTPIIAGLLEADRNKRWGYDKFFNELEVLLSHIIINIFYTNKAEIIKIYMLPNQTLNDLERYILAQTGIEPDNQILIYKSNCLKNFIQDCNQACEYPKTSEDHPFFLFSKTNDVFSTMSINIPPWDDFPVNVSAENNVTPARNACIVGYYCKYQIEKHSVHCKLIYDAVENFFEYVQSYTKNVFHKADGVSGKMCLLDKVVKLLQNTYNCSELKNINKELVTITTLVANLHSVQCSENDIKTIWDSQIKQLNCPFKTNASLKAKTHAEELRKSWQYFLKEPIISNISYNTSQWYVTERKRVRQQLSKLITLLNKEVIQYQHLAKHFEAWLESVIAIYDKINFLNKETEQCEEKLEKFESELTIAYNYTENNKQLCDDLEKDAERINKLRDFRKRVQDYFEKNDNFNEILLENSRLMQEIQETSVKL